ncbi:MAG: CpaF family protein, partial [Enterococcus sp.]|nr:CpaF family protein [Enterococcus sp.]
MSLAERVNIKYKGTFDNNLPQNNRFEALKAQVQSSVSMDSLAQLMVDNPRQAISEITRACNMAFEAKMWNNLDIESRQELIQQIINNVFGLGPLEELIQDNEITEVMVNGPDSVFYEKKGILYKHHLKFSSDEQIRALIDRILGPLGRRIDESSPMVNARLKQGHRVNAIIPPLSLVGSVLTIRKFSENVITLENMQSSGSIDAKVRKFLEWAIIARKNIAVSGGTGSGKTTLLNAMSCKIPFKERIITIEDSAELRFLEHPHVVKLEARPRNAEGKGEVSIRDLVINSLRMRPDRIVVGECRGGEALDMLQAMTTGHDGS